jgi:ABC-2 type transport system ATP-binding protein
MTPKPIIQVSNLTKYYGKHLGIKNIDFHVSEGEIFGFLGPNGAGKTTTIRLLLNLLHPSFGIIQIFGNKISQHSYQYKQKIGYLPGNFRAYQDMTTMEFLNFARNFRKSKSPLQKELINKFSLEQNLTKPIKKLSHGTQQKIGLVQAFQHKPQLAILDEPTTGLDPLIQEEFYSFLKEYQKQGNTIFFSSHNLPEVEKVCQRVAIIREGNLVASETLENLKSKRYRRLRIKLSKPIENTNIIGAELIKQDGLYIDYLVKGDIHTLLQSISKLPLEDFIFPEPDLEEVFMYYYRENKHG